MLENKNYNDDIVFDVYNPSILLCKKCLHKECYLDVKISSKIMATPNYFLK